MHLYIYIFHTYSCVSITPVALSVSFLLQVLLERCLSKVIFSGTWKKTTAKRNTAEIAGSFIIHSADESLKLYHTHSAAKGFLILT